MKDKKQLGSIAGDLAKKLVNALLSLVPPLPGGIRDPTVPSRPMKFPYTYSAKIAQFPYKFYYQNSPGYRYWVYAVIVCIPVFVKINNLANSPANVQKWEEIRRHEALEHAGEEGCECA